MKYTELRVGNIVEHEDPDEIVEGIHYVNEGDYRILIGNYLRPIEHIKPVPLTEEWLIKFGFNKNEYSTEGVQYNEPFYHIVLESKGWRLNYNEDFGWVIHPVVSDYNVIPIKYVHQLQNLYFALTGNELEIKN